MNELLDITKETLSSLCRARLRSVSRHPRERALVGALLKMPGRLAPPGLPGSSPEPSRIQIASNLAGGGVLRQGKPVDMVALADSIGGDAYDAMHFSPNSHACPTTAYASWYVDQVAESQRRRKLSDAARMAADALAKGGAVDVWPILKAAARPPAAQERKMPAIVSAVDSWRNQARTANRDRRNATCSSGRDDERELQGREIVGVACPVVRRSQRNRVVRQENRPRPLSLHQCRAFRIRPGQPIVPHHRSDGASRNPAPS